MKATNSFRICRRRVRRAIVLRTSVIALCGVFLALGLAGPSAEGCGWSGYERSLRFSDGSGVEDRLPPLPREYRTEYPEFEGDAFWGYYGEEDCCCAGDDVSEVAYRRVEELRRQNGDAMNCIGSGDIRGARRLLERILRDSAGFDRDASLGDDLHAQAQQLRNTAIDMLDVVRESERGVSDRAIGVYAQARVQDLSGKVYPDPWIEMAEIAAREPRFADNVAYLHGAYLYSQRRHDEAAAAFDELRQRWPASEKREAATYMAGVSWLRRAERLKEIGYWREAEEALDEATTRLDIVAKLGSGSVYSEDASGWIARAACAKRDMPTALVVYYTQLADREDRYVQLEAARSLNLVRRDAEDDEMLEVEKRIERSPDVALAYAYYEIYNHESFRDPDEFDDSETGSLSRTDQLNRIVAFCSRMSARWPAGTVGAGFALRVAGASLELDRPQDAERFAERALEAGPTDRERVEALYLAATAKHRLGDFDGARSAIVELRAAKPDVSMDERAGRLLAMVCEDDRDLAGALDEYRRLGYEADAAYVIDTLMSVGQLENYVSARPRDPDIDWLRYAVGIRLLRAGLYERAERALEQVRTTTSYADDLIRSNGYEDVTPWDGRNLKQSFGCDSRVRTPRQAWVARDLQTAKDLDALERLASQPSDREHAAEAQYQFASYLFEHESLLFYNPSLWWGNRAELLRSFEYSDGLRLPGEAENLWSETNAHDALAQSVDAFLDVVDRYPETKAAADALYSAAVAHERLANFNGYWRSQYEIGLHAGRRMVTYADVVRLYPNYRVPRATIGWEPSTRSVNGGPAWAPLPPKPKPVPLWRHYAKRVPEVIAEFGGPVVTAVTGSVRTATSWLVDLVKRATILAIQAILLAVIIGAWISAVRSSLKLALDATNGQWRARALLPASSSFRPREYAWLTWAGARLASLRRDDRSPLSIAGPGATNDTAPAEARLDDRVILLIERARLFVSSTPEGLALVLVVVTHLPILLFLAMAL
jgi:outer membrane protein assembly factor BamD (BamD/ComL family)